jgi:hypothetical protein
MTNSNLVWHAQASNRLPILAANIKDHVAAAEWATRRGLKHALAAGALLIEAKDLVAHGEWLPWLHANCRVSARQAQTFMRLARNRHKLDTLKSAATAYLTVAAAEALVGRPRREQPRGLPGQMDLLGGPEVTGPAAKSERPTCKSEPPSPKSERAISPLSDRDRVHRLIHDLQGMRTAAIRCSGATTDTVMLGEVITVLKKHLACLYSYCNLQA